MTGRARSALLAMGVGAGLGALALVVLLPARSAPPAASRAPSTSLAELPAETAPPPPTPCPDDMALVEDVFCSELAYVCARPGDESGFGCAEYQRGQRCTGELDPRRFCIDRYEWPNRLGERPEVYVDWYQAKQLCLDAGKRLCRRSEWMLACEGPKRMPYPWGYQRQPSPCNVDRVSIPFDIGALLEPSTRPDELLRLWQAEPAGSRPRCVSSHGVYDLTGNVDEWTDNQADNPHTQYVSTLNGGYWGPVRNTCRLATRSHGPTFRFYQVGFRCCAEPRDGVAFPEPRPFVEDERPARGGSPPAPR